MRNGLLPLCTERRKVLSLAPSSLIGGGDRRDIFLLLLQSFELASGVLFSPRPQGSSDIFFNRCTRVKVCLGAACRYAKGVKVSVGHRNNTFFGCNFNKLRCSGFAKCFFFVLTVARISSLEILDLTTINICARAQITST